MAVDDTSPMVCTACTTYMSTMRTMASGWNSRPKWNGTGTENHAAALTSSNATMPPMNRAMAYPTMMPTIMPDTLM